MNLYRRNGDNTEGKTETKRRSCFEWNSALKFHLSFIIHPSIPQRWQRSIKNSSRVAIKSALLCIATHVKKVLSNQHSLSCCSAALTHPSEQVENVILPVCTCMYNSSVFVWKGSRHTHWINWCTYSLRDRLRIWMGLPYKKMVKENWKIQMWPNSTMETYFTWFSASIFSVELIVGEFITK